MSTRLPAIWLRLVMASTDRISVEPHGHAGAEMLCLREWAVRGATARHGVCDVHLRSPSRRTACGPSRKPKTMVPTVATCEMALGNRHGVFVVQSSRVQRDEYDPTQDARALVERTAIDRNLALEISDATVLSQVATVLRAATPRSP